MQKAPSHERPLNVWMFFYSSRAQTLSISILSAGLLLFSFFPLFCSPSYSPRIDQGHGILHNYRLWGHDWLMSDRTLTEAWTLRSESKWVSDRVFNSLFLFFVFFFKLNSVSVPPISALDSTTKKKQEKGRRTLQSSAAVVFFLSSDNLFLLTDWFISQVNWDTESRDVTRSLMHHFS